MFNIILSYLLLDTTIFKKVNENMKNCPDSHEHEQLGVLLTTKTPVSK